jgi:hypothetical protein
VRELLMRTAALGLTVVLVPSLAGAQTPVRSLAEASRLLRPGDRVEVVGTDGSRVSGSLSRISESGLALDVEGRTIDRPAPAIASIDRRGDSLMNGLGVGLVAGAGAGLGLAAAFAGSESGEGFEDRILVAVPLAGAGAGLGLLLDALFEGRTPVYRAPAPPRVALAPILSRAR